jgi:transcription termination factor NusB
MRHYSNESIRRESCDLKSDKEHSVFQIMSQISRAAGKDGIAAAALGHVNTKGVNRSHINVEELRKKKAENKYEPGGNRYDEYYLLKLYGLVFFSKYQFNFYTFPTTFIMNENLDRGYDITIDLSKISNDLINNSKAVNIVSTTNYTEGHASAFYTCGGSQIYYEDNSGIYPFPWKEFLLKAVELYKNDASTKLFCGNNNQSSNVVEAQGTSFYPIIRTGKTKPFTYYTFIKDSPLLESRDGTFEYNDISVKMLNMDKAELKRLNLKEEASFWKIDSLNFITINNDQAVNAQRFNHTARHGSVNLNYFRNLVENNPDAEKILQFLNEYIQSNIFAKDIFSALIKLALEEIRPINPELNNRLLELAATQLDPTEVEKLRTKIPPIWMNKRGNIDDKYLDTLIAAKDSEGILNIFTEYLNSNEFKSTDRSVKLFNSSFRVFTNFIPINIELFEKLFELIKDNIGEYKEGIQKLINYKKNIEKYKANQISEGGYRKRKTRYQKRLIKRKTQKKRRSRR